MTGKQIPLVRVNQWLKEWDLVPTDADRFQAKPPKFFYIASISARDLRALSGVYPRDAVAGSVRADDPHIQRSLDTDRTEEITNYVRFGYPLSGLGRKRLPAGERDSLRKPGWLPTAIVANVISAGSKRGNATLNKRDAMTVAQSESGHDSIALPESWSASGWRPGVDSIPPLEIIDGQHRLSAFDDSSEGDFDLPVVIFDDLDFSWQAYLFWTINIKPKRINASLAYDLYPLLREQDWLEAGEGLNVYRETRSQELVEALWRDTHSVWFDRINMLGQRGVRGDKPVTQSAFIGALSTTFVRPFKGQKGLGGLFGGGADGAGLKWPRTQQAAFLLYAWHSLAMAIASRSWDWALPLRGLLKPESHDPWAELEPKDDPAVVSDKTLLSSDQGVRAFHMVVNDLLYLRRDFLQLDQWLPDEEAVSAEDSVGQLFDELDSIPIGDALRNLGLAIASFDWRNSQAPGLSSLEKELKLSLRGSGGYNVLRDRLLRHLVLGEFGWISEGASDVMEARGIARE